MRIIIPDSELKALCNEMQRLKDRFGDNAEIVARRLQALDAAENLASLSSRPPHRRRQETMRGPSSFSICARGAGRIYFNAAKESAKTDEEIDVIEITYIGWRT